MYEVAQTKLTRVSKPSEVEIKELAPSYKKSGSSSNSQAVGSGAKNRKSRKAQPKPTSISVDKFVFLEVKIGKSLQLLVTCNV